MENEKQSVSRKQFIKNMEDKLTDKDFINDIFILLPPKFEFSNQNAFEIVKAEILEKL